MFTPYPAVTQSDPMQQMLGQVMGGYKPNQLGAGVTLGNPEAQQDYIAELAKALADGEFSAKQIEQAGSMLTPEFIQNSGLAGVADMVLKTYVGKKMDEKGRTLQADAETRRMSAQEGVDDRRAMKEAERSETITTRERTRRQSLASQMGLSNREAVEFIETGKVPDDPKTEYDIREVNGELFYVPKNPQMAGPQDAPQNSPAADAGFDQLRDAVEWQESRGNPGAVSPKGAKGRMQTMPGTLRDPGYGIAPARDDSDAEMTRVGNEYLAKMTEKYGIEGGLAAYNWGPGNWESALERAGGDPQRALAMAPEETRKYVPSVLGRAQGGTNEQYVSEAGVPAGAMRVPGTPRATTKRGDAPSGYRWREDGSQEAVPGGPADRKNNPVPSDLAKGEMGQRKEVSDRIQGDRAILGMHRNIGSALKSGTAAGDLSAIFAYMKILDPGSVVREQEFANAQNATGVPDRVRNLYNQVMSGNRLNDSQRKEFMAEADKIAASAQDRITNVAREYQGIADDYGYDPVRATGMPDFRNVNKKAPPAEADDDLIRKYL